MFITKLISDSMVDGWCYSCSSRRHATPLIMGYCDSLVSDKEEKILMLKCLDRMCQVAEKQMVEVKGYLSWLNCLDFGGEFGTGKLRGR